MTGKILRDVSVIAVLGLATAYAAIHKEEIYEKLGFTLTVTRNNSDEASVNSQPVIEQTLPITKLQGVAVSIPKSKTDGQYWMAGRVNNGMINFLVDTGASSIALTPEDARRAGINLDTLEYNIAISTAGGQNVAAAVNLKTVSIGPITLRNVRAIVIPEGLHTSLLGMTFLGQLQKVEATPHALILRL